MMSNCCLYQVLPAISSVLCCVDDFAILLRLSTNAGTEHASLLQMQMVSFWPATTVHLIVTGMLNGMLNAVFDGMLNDMLIGMLS